MHLLNYVNKTNPDAFISGVCTLTDEQLTAFNANIETVKAQITPTTMFIFPVGQGFILHPSADELNQCYTITPIDEADLPILQKYGIDNMGFARHFANGVINVTAGQFVPVPTEPAP